MSAPEDRPANPTPPVPGLSRFDWGLLTGLAALQLVYLGGWAVFARWVVRRFIGA